MSGNRARKFRLAVLSFLVAAMIAVCGCNRGANQNAHDSGSSLDRVSQVPNVPPQPIAHGLTKVQKYMKFAFEVPAHVISPRVTGEFSSFIQGAGGARIADESADVELLIMSEEQYQAFENKTSAESVYAIEPSHDHEVSITLPGTQDAPARYYAVFRRTNDGKSPIWVNANLIAEFGSL